MSNDTVTLYAVKGSRASADDTGYLLPIAIKEHDLWREVGPEDFPNAGKVYVTRNFSSFEDKNSLQNIYLVEANVAPGWDAETAHDGRCKYSTYDSLISSANALEIAAVVSGEYPNPSLEGGMTLTTDGPPPDGYFFLSCRAPSQIDVLIGPLSVVRDSVSESDGAVFSFSYQAVDRPLPGPKWGQLTQKPHSAFAFESTLIPSHSVVTSDIGQFVLEDVSRVHGDVIDLATPDQILKWANKILRSSGSDAASAASSIRKVITALDSQDLSDPYYRERLSRLSEVQDRLGSMSDLPDLLGDYLTSNRGKQTLEGYVQANRTSLLEEYLADEKQAETVKLRQELERERVTQEGNLLAVKTQIEELRAQQEALKNEIQDIEATDLEERIHTLREEMSTLEDLRTVRQEVDYLQRKKSEEQALVEEATSQLEGLTGEIGRKSQQHKDELMKLKIQLDSLQGATPNLKGAKLPALFQEKSRIVGSDDAEKKRNLLQLLLTAFEKHGRDIDQDFAAGFLVSFSQNLITTIAGDPGSGKTSFIRLFAAVLGLDKASRFVPVQVQRGWSSDRDILGFYNKLSGFYEPDRHGLYDLIVGLRELPIEEQLSVVLLDEANLSPMEHYWATFMGATDDSSQFSLDGAHEVELSKMLRFLATVNSDSTTEPLSPRLLDRSPVFYLESAANLFDTDLSDVDAPETISLDASEFTALFQPPLGAELSNDEKRLLAELRQFRILPMSHRKQMQIRDMALSLRGMLESGPRLTELDLALSVLWLPRLNGQGSEYKKSLASLADTVEAASLNKCAKVLRRILETSEYDYFSFL